MLESSKAVVKPDEIQDSGRLSESEIMIAEKWCDRMIFSRRIVITQIITQIISVTKM